MNNQSGGLGAAILALLLALTTLLGGASPVPGAVDRDPPLAASVAPLEAAGGADATVASPTAIIGGGISVTITPSRTPPPPPTGEPGNGYPPPGLPSVTAPPGGYPPATEPPPGGGPTLTAGPSKTPSQTPTPTAAAPD